MKWASTISESPRLQTAIDEAVTVISTQLEGRQPDLIIAFVSEHHKQHYAEMTALLRQKFATCHLLGSSAGGVIGGGQEIEQSPGLSLTAACLPGVTLTPFQLEQDHLPDIGADTETWRQRLGIDTTEPLHFILLADPFSFNAEPLIRALDRHFPDSCKVGGLVSGASRPGEHRLFIDGDTYRSGVAGLAMQGNINVATIVAQGCRPIGEPLFVTEVDDNRILGLDGHPPLTTLRDLYEQLDERDQELLQHALFLGITMQSARSSYRQGDFLIRNIIGIDSENGALAVAAVPQLNSVVQFHLRDAQTSADDLDALLKNFNGVPQNRRPQGSLLFSCLGRGVHLYGEPGYDSQVFQRYMGPVPLGGFFCNGEIGPVQGTTFLHGYTSAFGLFSPLSDE